MSEDFQPFQIGQRSDFSTEQKFETKDFRISKNLSAAIVENPGLKEVLEEEVQKRLEERLLQDNADKLQQMFEQAKAEGREAGLEKAKTELAAFKAILEALERELVAQKKTLFAEIEEDWTRALRTVLEKSFIGGAKELAHQVGLWLAEQSEHMEGPLVVSVAPSQYEAFHKEWEILGGKSVRFEKDEKLREGEFRLKSHEGEQLFAPKQALEKLDSIISNHFQRDKI
ncbi:MAG: hypothetical protein H6617_04370 [Bdellovibrionaceae bacterium]|nr:hypothetical protein [Pseudobdellovibrionaceae bacterium]